MLAQSPNDLTLMSRSLKPTLQSSIIGDLATGACYGAAILCCVFGKYVPDAAKTVALIAAGGAATAQYFANSDEDLVNAAIANDALRETELRGINNQLMDRQGMERSQAEIQAQIALLHQIAQAPKVLQPLLLEQNGFGNIIPLLQESPKAKPVKGMKSPQTWDEGAPADDLAEQPRFDWLKEFDSADVVLLWGPMGSGKTTLGYYLAQRRLSQGHDLEALDPHMKYGAWQGVRRYGAGKNYAAVNDRLENLSSTIVERYEEYGCKPEGSYHHSLLTIIAEEMLQWGKKCPHSATFLQEALSDIRKINIGVILISHGRNLGNIGGATGMAKTRDNEVFEIQTLKHKRGKGHKAKIRRPGEKDWIEVDVPDLSDFEFSVSPNAAEDFADESGLSGDLPTDDRIDDTADLINLRQRYQEAPTKPDGQELVSWWNEVATIELEADTKTITGLLHIVKMDQAEFDEFIKANLD